MSPLFVIWRFCRVGFSPPLLDKELGGLKPTLRFAINR